MRTPSSVAVVGCIGLAAACSHPKPPDASQLDLVLGDGARPTHVVSALEIWGKAKATPAAPATEGVVAKLHAHRKAPSRRLAFVPKRARGPERAPLLGHEVQPNVAVAPAPAPAAQPEPAPAPVPDTPQPADPQPGQGRGGWFPEPSGGGIHIPGFPGGGVIIIRGGHSGMDPCDEHGRGGFPGMPGRGRRFPGGIVFLRGR